MFSRHAAPPSGAVLRLKPLVLAVSSASLTLACVVVPLSATAAAAVAPASTATVQVRPYRIAPGPLQNALADFAAQAQLTVSFVPDLIRGKRSAGLQGTYAPADALHLLVAGTGLEAVAQGEGIFVLREQVVGAPGADAAAGAGAVTLQEVAVTSEAARDSTTEGTDTYKALYTNTATKLALSPRETPQTITTITRQQMDDVSMTSVDDALKSVSGVFAQDQGSAGATYYSRGFTLQTQLDGIVTPAGINSGNRSPKFDTAFVDRVEVLQGAAGLLAGAGSPGGTVNLVRKRPIESFQAQAEVQLGSWNARRFVGDISGPLIESGRIRGRLVALDDRADSFTDYVFRDRQAVYGIVEADLSPHTLLSASVQYQQDTSLNHFGVPYGKDGRDANLPRSSFWGDPNYRLARDYSIYTVGVSQRLPGDWTLKGAYSRQRTVNDIDNFNSLTGSLDVTTGNGLAIASRSRNNSSVLSSDSADVYASGPLSLLGRKHELVVGANGATYRDESTGTGYIAGSIPINVYDFNPESLGPVANGTASRAKSTTTNYGMYGVARWNLTDALKVITGMRISNYEVKNAVTGRIAPKANNQITPYAGVVYDLNRQYSAYVSYSDIFNPQTNRSIDGSVLKPVVGANYEAGIKGEVLDKRLNVSAAVFRLDQSNLAVRDDSIPSDPGNACGGICYDAAGKVVSQGVDLGVNGKIGRNLNLAAGYTFTDAEYKAGPQQGQRFGPEQPRHSLRLAAHYRLPDTDWSFGGNVETRSKIYRTGGTGANAWTIRQGALLLLGVHARYQVTPKTQLLFAISNLTDRRYRGLYSLNYSPYGEPRRVSVNLKHTF